MRYRQKSEGMVSGKSCQREPMGGRQMLFYSSPAWKVNVMARATLAILQ